MARGPEVVVLEVLSPHLGPHTASTALRTFAQRACGRTPDALTASDTPALLSALRPMLAGLLGGKVADELLRRCSTELEA